MPVICCTIVGVWKDIKFCLETWNASPCRHTLANSHDAHKHTENYDVWSTRASC